MRRRSPDEKNALAGQKGSTLGNFSPDGKSIFFIQGLGEWGTVEKHKEGMGSVFV